MTALSNHPIKKRTLILTQSDSIHSRRKFLLGSSAVSLATFLPKSFATQPASTQKSDEGNPVFESTPKDASLKFNPDGTRRPFAGNTVICPSSARFVMKLPLLEMRYAQVHLRISWPFFPAIAIT
jgi:hypothetical protein